VVQGSIWSGQRSEGGEQSGASVVGARPAEPDHDLLHVGGDRGQDQFADSPGAGPLRVSLVLRRQVDSAGLRAFDVRRAIRDQDRPGHRIAIRARDRHREQVATKRGVQHVAETGATVGHRHQVQFVLRGAPAPSFGNGFCGLHRGERAGELVGGDQDAHRPILPSGPTGRAFRVEPRYSRSRTRIGRSNSAQVVLV